PISSLVSSIMSMSSVYLCNRCRLAGHVRRRRCAHRRGCYFFLGSYPRYRRLARRLVAVRRRARYAAGGGGGGFGGLGGSDFGGFGGNMSSRAVLINARF